MSAIIAALLLVCSMGAVGATGEEAASVDRSPIPVPTKSPKKSQPTVVTSNSAEVDYANNTAEFRENVHVKDAGGDMWADKMVVNFDGNTRQIKSIIATGKKVITDAHGKRSESRKAVYTASDGKIVLTGNPFISEGGNTYAAEKIIIFRDSEKTIFEPSARLIFYSDRSVQAP
jgi:lipopolysaccharide transport protein LptA